MKQTPPPKSNPASTKKQLLNILAGGIAGTLAIGTVYPMETIKTVMQLRSEAKEPTSISKIFSHQMKAEGFMSFYRGLPAALMRQFFFASLRLGLYFNYADYLKAKQKKDVISLPESVVGSLATAAIGISAVMPFDVIFTRFQSDSAVPVAQRRGYTGLGNAMSRIIKEEGAITLWRGITPAIGRAMSLNFGMLVPYEKCKAALAPYLGWTRTNYLASAAIAGFGASLCCLPFDNAKVKLQKMAKGTDGKMPYKGLVDCMSKTIKNEGVIRLWSGFLPFYLVIGTHSMLTLLISDYIRILLGLSSK